MDHEQVKTVARRVISGESKIVRLNEREERGRILGGRRNVEASLLIGANQSADKTSGRRERKTAEEKILEDYAKAEGFWIDDLGTLIRNLEFLKQGMESKVYWDKNNPTSVIKLTPIPHIFGADSSVLRFLDDKIALHNALPYTAPYELTAFSRDTDGTFLAVLEQPFIQGEETTNLNTDLVKQMQADAGLLLDYTGKRFTNDRLSVLDIDDHNVIKGKDGQFYIFDPIISLTDESKYQPFSIEKSEDHTTEVPTALKSAIPPVGT